MNPPIDHQDLLWRNRLLSAATKRSSTMLQQAVANSSSRDYRGHSIPTLPLARTLPKLPPSFDPPQYGSSSTLDPQERSMLRLMMLRSQMHDTINEQTHSNQNDRFNPNRSMLPLKLPPRAERMSPQLPDSIKQKHEEVLARAMAAQQGHSLPPGRDLVAVLPRSRPFVEDVMPEKGLPPISAASYLIQEAGPLYPVRRSSSMIQQDVMLEKVLPPVNAASASYLDPDAVAVHPERRSPSMIQQDAFSEKVLHPMNAASYLGSDALPVYPESRTSSMLQRIHEEKQACRKRDASGNLKKPSEAPIPKPAKKPKAPRKKKKKAEEKKKGPNKKDHKWLQSLAQLVEYKNEFGDCIVPRGYAPNPRLASWVAEQRKQYKLLKDGKQSSITPLRIEHLERLDFAWNAQDAAWEKHFFDLQRFKEEFGDCLVPLGNPRFPKLGLWIKEQRRHYTLMKQGKKSHMTEERSLALDSIGFCWDTHEQVWGERLRELCVYRAVHGDCLVTTNTKANGLGTTKLATWVHHQRRQYKKFKEGKPSHITSDRIRALEAIGFVWDPRKETRNSTWPDEETDSESEAESCYSSEDFRPSKRQRF